MPIGCAAVGLLVGAVLSRALPGAPGPVEKQGQETRVLLEHPVTGHLAEINGRYQLRLTEVDYTPGGFIGVHHHAGPGIRYVIEGQLTYVQPGRTTLYGPGDAFYESGDTTHTAYNRTQGKVRLINFELLPAGWKGGSAIPPMDSTPAMHAPAGAAR